MAEQARFDPLPDLHMDGVERFDAVLEVLPRAWDAASSTDLAWRPEAPGRGQDFATAAVVLDYFSGMALQRSPEAVAADGITYSNIVRGREIFIRNNAVVVETFRPGNLAKFAHAFTRSSRLGLVDTYPKLRSYQILRWGVDALMADLDHSRERYRERQAALAAAAHSSS